MINAPNDKQLEKRLKKPVLDPFTPTLTPDMLLPVTKEEREQLVQMRDSTTFWRDAMRRFRRNKVAMLCAGVLVLVAFFAYVGPFFMPYTYDQLIRGHERLPPMLDPFFHPFGTDQLGRDLLVRVMVGTRITLLIGVVASLFVLAIGTVYGAVSGFAGGIVDTVMMRIAEVINSIPNVMMIILLQVSLKEPLTALFNRGGLRAFSSFGAGLISIFVTFALLYWVPMARLVRGEILALKNSEYVTASRALGGKGKWIIFKHLIPNSVGTIIVTTMFQIPTAIFTESFLSFIGLGVNAPLASLGSLVNDSLTGFQSFPYRLIIPAVMIAVIILALNQLGDGLRDALDPRIRD